MRTLVSGMGLLAALALSCACSMPVQAESDRPAAKPGSFQAIMAEKLPGIFGPHLAAADQPAAAAPTGSFNTVMAVKMPGVYGPHLAAADAPPAPVAAADTCRAGSFAALMAAKLPPNARPGSPELYKDCH